MAQTTTYYSMADAKVEFGVNGTAWTDASGMASEVSVEGGERNTASKHTFSGDTPIITKGKRTALTITINSVYTEGVTDIRKIAQTAYEAGSAFYVRWSPRGGSSGNLQFTAGPGIVKQALYPVGEPGDGETIMVSVVVEVASIAEAAVTP